MYLSLWTRKLVLISNSPLDAALWSYTSGLVGRMARLALKGTTSADQRPFLTFRRRCSRTCSHCAAGRLEIDVVGRLRLEQTSCDRLFPGWTRLSTCLRCKGGVPWWEAAGRISGFEKKEDGTESGSQVVARWLQGSWWPACPSNQVSPHGFSCQRCHPRDPTGLPYYGWSVLNISVLDFSHSIVDAWPPRWCRLAQVNKTQITQNKGYYYWGCCLIQLCNFWIFLCWFSSGKALDKVLRL